MTKLYADWDEGRVRDAIREIVADADEAYGGESLWPVDEWDAWQTPTPLKTLLYDRVRESAEGRGRYPFLETAD